jgi:hypothetical protein
MSAWCGAETMPAVDALLAGRFLRSSEALHLIEYMRRHASTCAENNRECAARVALEEHFLSQQWCSMPHE